MTWEVNRGINRVKQSFGMGSTVITPFPGRFWRKAYFQGVFGNSEDMVVTEKVAEKS